MNRLEDIVLFGCGKIATEFYLKYKPSLKVNYVVSNNPKEEIFSPDGEIAFEVKRPNPKEGIQKQKIIICCAEHEKVAEQLILLGYTPFIDFFDYEMASILLDEKKIVLLYGFCHLRAIKDCLVRITAFSERYVAFYFSNYLHLSPYQVGRLQFCIDQCSVYIYGMEMMPEHHRKNEAIIQRLKQNVLIMQLPGVYFGGYFPQKQRTYNQMNRYAVKCENYDYTPFSYGDCWLNECIDKGLTSENVIELLQTAKIFEQDYILRYLENEWIRLKFQERTSEFKIAEYIEKNYKKKRLFRNEMHMENGIIYEYVKQIMERLNCPTEVIEVESPLFQCSQHIIYPDVAKALELEWNVWEEELDIYTYAGWKKCSMNDYISCYMKVCNSIRILKKESFLP